MPQAPYGEWKSPIGAAAVARSSVKLEELQLRGGDVFWTERRPEEGGRTVLCRWTAGDGTDEITPAPWSVRTRVHDYGGGAFLVGRREVFFAQQDTQLWYRCRGPHDIQALTTDPRVYHADPCEWGEALVAVQEVHRTGEPVVNHLVRVMDGEVLAQGMDFYASPAASSSGALAWLCWNHPRMPWDGTELWVLDADGRRQQVAGGVTESIFQPQWGEDGLYFVSDRGGWWNLWRWDFQTTCSPLLPMAAEFGRPQWVFGMSTYAVVGPDRIVCSWYDGVRWNLGLLTNGQLRPYDLDCTEIRSVRANAAHAVFIGEHPARPAAVLRLDLKTGSCETIRSAGVAGDTRYYSYPESIEFPTREGGIGYARFYRPANPDVSGPDGQRPPLLVKSHGGPTSCTVTSLNLEIQYWTSRGIGVLDVDYGGSTGHGRPYRERLKGQWGVVDVHDCADAALYLVAQGAVDGDRLAMDGRSAGGYTTLAALTFTDVFKAGASLYGVSDLEALQLETHKFESHYNDGLVGPYPQAVSVYHERSPIHHVDRLSCPIILLQGTEDRVVPPAQAHTMFAALKAKGIPVALLLFEGEDHGFRQAANIQRALEAEFLFFATVFRFTPADALPPISIENLQEILL